MIIKSETIMFPYMQFDIHKLTDKYCLMVGRRLVSVRRTMEEIEKILEEKTKEYET